MRTSRFALPMSLLTVAGVCVAPALAQRGSRTIMHGNADGTHEVLMLTAPDYATLREPDFTARDLPLIKLTLVLSEEQSTIVRQIIEHYLGEFRALTQEFAAQTEPEAEYVPEGEKKAGAKDGAPEEPPTTVRLDDLDLPAGINVSFGTSVGRSSSDDPNVPAPLPQVKVTVWLDAAEGVDLSQELLDTIRERANQTAATIAERIMAEEAARQAGEPEPKPVFEHDRDFETLKAEHDALLAKVEDFIKAKGKLREELVLAAHAILSTEQVEHWPALERALYRQRHLSKGQMPGESLDLIKIIQELELDDEQRQSIAADMEAYEIALDAALRQRDSLLATSTQKIDEAIANKNADLALSLVDRVISTRVAIRALNQQHIEYFANALGPLHGEECRVAALKQCYPHMYAQTRGRKMFALLNQMPDLDEESRSAIAALQTSYEAELERLNQQLRAMIDREAATGARRGIEHLKDSIEGRHSKAMDYQDPIRPLYAKRGELDDHYLKLVGDIIGSERAAELPKPPRNRGPIKVESDPVSEE